MEIPKLFGHRRVASDTEILPAFMPVPGMGVLPVNAYLIRAAEPVLVDAGLGALADDLVSELQNVLDPGELRWIWITHTDPDHVGALWRILELAPQARIVTTYLGMGKLGMLQAIAPERIYLLNPGQSLEVGDRTLRAIKPPSFDAPETTALLDTRSGVLFSSDCFGAVMSAPRERAGDIPIDELAEGLVTWATVDAPWLHMTTERWFDRALERLRSLRPSAVLSSHLPPAIGMTDRLLSNLRVARGASPFVGPDQDALTQMMAAAA